jgi:plastocyanin
MRPILCTTLLCAAALALGASSPTSSAGTAATASPAGAKPVRVVMRKNRFHPRRAVLRLGRTVRWVNRDKTVHTVVSADLDISSDGIRGGRTFSYRPRRRGTFDYFCTIHAGQEGVLVVR